MIANLVEGTFGRLFRSEVRPIELAHKLAREMDEHTTTSVARTYGPNEYSVWLSPQDRARYEGVEQEVIDELCAYLLEHARREGLALASAPSITFHTDDALALGEFGIKARLVRAAELRRGAIWAGRAGLCCRVCTSRRSCRIAGARRAGCRPCCSRRAGYRPCCSGSARRAGCVRGRARICLPAHTAAACVGLAPSARAHGRARGPPGPRRRARGRAGPHDDLQRRRACTQPHRRGGRASRIARAAHDRRPARAGAAARWCDRSQP